MADLARIKRNVAKMVSMQAPESDIDAYISSEGVTVDDVRNFRPEPVAAAQASQQPQQPQGDVFGGVMQSLGDFNSAFQAGANQGITLGFGDELYAGMAAPFSALGPMFAGEGYDLGGAYQRELDTTRARIAADQAKNPIAATAGDIVGSVATGGTLAKGGLTLMKGASASIPSLATRGALEGAAYGGANGFGRAEGDLDNRLSEAGSGAAWGAGLGGAIGAGAGALAGRSAARSVPTVDDLKAQAGALYDAAEAKGVIFPKAGVKPVVDDITATVISEGIDPALHPRATAALKRLQSVGETGMTVKEAQTMRRILAAAGKDFNNPDEARIASIMIQKLDDFVAQGAPELAQARGVYHQAKKGEMIEQAIELAGSRAGQFSGSGFENALRTEFRAIERQIIKGQLKGLSPDEVAAITKVARGGPIENIARYVGKLAPTGVVSFGAGAGVPFMLGNAVGGPAVGAAAAGATMGAGVVGRSLATKLTAANARSASELVRSGGGGATPLPQLTPAQLQTLRAIVAGSGNAAAKLPGLPTEIAVPYGTRLK